MKRAVSLAIVIVGIVLILYTVVSNQAKPKVQQSPQVTLLTSNGSPITIGGQSGRWTFVNVWASWCGPCKEEAPALVKVANKLGDRVDFIGLNATSEDSREDAEAFVATYKITYPIVYDLEGKAIEAFQIVGYPTSFLISPKGNIVETFEGAYSEQAFIDAIEAQLKKG